MIIFFFRYYDDDPYDRRSIQRSLSQPSLARSATEITERWAIPDDVSEDSESPRNSNRLVSISDHIQNVTKQKDFHSNFHFAPADNIPTSCASSPACNY